MKHQTGKRTSMPRCAWPLALVAISAFAVALLAQLGSTVHAQEPDSDLGSQVSNTPPPPGDCWSGALSDDPLHCYALEEAQRDGIIEVEGVYDASGELHIFFNYRTGPPVSALFDQGRLEELVEVLKDNAREFVAQFPERVTYNLPFHFCGPPDPAETYRDCILNRTFELVVVPWDSPYIRIFLVSGGADARQTFPGWASWLQIWPATESSAAAASDGFDISDVDLVNFPEKMKCEDGFYSDYACEMAKQYPSWNIAGWHESEKDLFIQVKADPGEKPPPGEEDTAVAFLRAEFARRYGDTDSYGRLRDAVITPVKYSYEELWRWQLLLERFAVSSGNTIGITGADVVTNVTDYWVADNIVYLLSELQEADRNSFADFRETIAVYTSHDADQVTSLLPILLPQLGIPGDAVGILMQSSPTPPDIVVADIEIAGETANSAVDNAPGNVEEEVDKAEQEANGASEVVSAGVQSTSEVESETNTAGEEKTQVDEQVSDLNTTRAEASEVVRVKSVSADNSPSNSASDETIKAEQETADLRDSSLEPADVASDHTDTTADDAQKIVVEETVVEAKDDATVLSESSIETGEAGSNETAAADGNSSEATIAPPLAVNNRPKPVRHQPWLLRLVVMSLPLPKPILKCQLEMRT